MPRDTVKRPVRECICVGSKNHYRAGQGLLRPWWPGPDAAEAAFIQGR